MNRCVSKDQYGDVLVETEDGYVASRINGIWINKIMFDMYSLRDELIICSGDEAQELYNAAIHYLQDYCDLR